MDISRVISIVRTLKEQPENSTGSTAGTNPTAGFSQNSNAAGPVAGIDKRLFPAAIDDLSQDYQSPGQTGLAVWRFSNVYPVQKLGDGGVDSMVDASKEYVNKMNEQRPPRPSKTPLENIMDIVRSLNEEGMVGGAPTNNVGSGNIAGTREAGDDPPVKKKKKYIYGGRGSRKMWLANKK